MWITLIICVTIVILALIAWRIAVTPIPPEEERLFEKYLDEHR